MFRMPSTRPAFWRNKITQNVKRDQRAQAKLADERWRVLMVWECALRGRARRPIGAVLDEIVGWLTTEASERVIQGTRT
jgi:DNA mismatch endonuclease (patch repair protein)